MFIDGERRRRGVRLGKGTGTAEEVLRLLLRRRRLLQLLVGRRAIPHDGVSIPWASEIVEQGVLSLFERADMSRANRRLASLLSLSLSRRHHIRFQGVRCPASTAEENEEKEEKSKRLCLCFIRFDIDKMHRKEILACVCVCTQVITLLPFLIVRLHFRLQSSSCIDFSK